MAGASSPLLLTAFIALIIWALAIRGQLSPDVITDLQLPFSKTTLGIVAFVSLLAWAVAGV